MPSKDSRYIGSIHDSDFTIGYLRSLPQSSNEMQEIVDKESDIRRLQFEKFLNYSKRRLRILPDSFLFKIRTIQIVYIEREVSINLDSSNIRMSIKALLVRKPRGDSND